MDKEKILKSISLSKLKILEPTEETKEQRVRFVASTAKEDRDYEIVQIDTFRLPLKGGGHIKVSELPTGGSDKVDIPFLTNHTIRAVEKTIGSVRKAYFENGQLIFEAGISKREYAQDVFKLIEEGHLDNAFSIQFRDYDWNMDTATLSNGEIIEVSLVVRGSNMDAQVLDVKALKGANMDSDYTQTKATDESTKQNAEPQTQTPEDQTTDKVEVTASQTTGDEEAKEKIMNTENLGAKATADITAQTKIANEDAEKGLTKPSQAHYTNSADYLSTKGAVLEFAKISKACGGDPNATRERWAEKLSEKGVTISDGSSFYPTEVEQVIFKAWHDAIGALSTFRRTRAKLTRFYAMTTSSRGSGHTKGQKKQDQDVVAIPRNAGLRVVYKKLPLDWIDIVNDDSGELYVFRTRELYDRVLHEIVRGAILGDGRTEPASGQPDYRVFVDGTGLYSMAADINASGTAGTYAAAVATLIANVSTDDSYDKIVKTLSKVRIEEGSGKRKVLAVKEGTMAALLLEKNENGGRLYAPGTNFRELFDVADIIEFPAADMEAVGLDVIAYATESYTLGGPDATVRNWFDGTVNQDVMLVEQPVLGSLEGYHVAAGYASK